VEEECVFCKIVEGKLKAWKVYEDDSTLAILDIKPVMDARNIGQCVVFPKKHVSKYYELDDEELAKLFKAVKRVAIKILEKLKPKYLTTFVRGMRVPGHAHILLIPSTGESAWDMMLEASYLCWLKIPPLSEEEMEKVAKLLGATKT